MKYNSVKLVLVTSFLLSFFCFKTSTAQECKYSEYYQFTDLAKKSFSKKKYKDARKYFQLAFGEIDFPLGHDLSFALNAANQIKDHAWANSVAERLAKGGVPLRYFSRFKKKKWYPKFQANFKNYSDYYDENYNQDLRQALIALLKRDVESTNNYHKWRTREVEVSLSDLIEDRSGILLDFEKLVSKYGFPHEKKMGYNYVRRKNSIEPFKIDVLMIHIHQFGVLFLKDAVPSIVCEGGLSPEFEKTLENNIQGFGNSTGVEQEMKARYLKFRPEIKNN